MNIEQLQKDSYRVSTAHGFYEDRAKPSVDLIAVRLMLIVSELAEALEEIRSGYHYGAIYENKNKPEGFPIELADAIIRIADTAEWLGINLTEAIQLKQDYNETRPYKHGKEI